MQIPLESIIVNHLDPSLLILLHLFAKEIFSFFYHISMVILRMIQQPFLFLMYQSDTFLPKPFTYDLVNQLSWLSVNLESPGLWVLAMALYWHLCECL